MKSFVPTLAFAVMLLGLEGCISPAAYQPLAYNSFGYGVGFISQQINWAEFQVGFVGNTKTDAQRTADFALLRAADLTLENHFSSFVVSHEQRRTEVITVRLPQDLDEKDPSDPYQEPANAAATNSFRFESTGSKMAVNKISLWIHCYSNPLPPGLQGEVYDARQVSNKFRAKYSLPSSLASTH
jgi:hypothetical protein